MNFVVTKTSTEDWKSNFATPNIRASYFFLLYVNMYISEPRFIIKEIVLRERDFFRSTCAAQISLRFSEEFERKENFEDAGWVPLRAILIRSDFCPGTFELSSRLHARIYSRAANYAPCYARGIIESLSCDRAATAKKARVNEPFKPRAVFAGEREGT